MAKSKAKFKVAHSQSKQICVEIRNEEGEPLVLVPNTEIELEPEVAARVMELYPRRLLPVAEEKKAPPGPGEKKAEVVNK